MIRTESGDIVIDPGIGKTLHEPRNVVSVLVTHAHTDHVVKLDNYLNRGASLFTHEGTLRELRVFRGLDPLHKCTFTNPVPNYVNGIYVVPVPTDHYPFHTHGFLLDVEGSTVLVTGDWYVDDEPLWERVTRALNKHGVDDVDVLVTEATNPSYNPPAAQDPVETLRRVVKWHDPDTVLVHLFPGDIPYVAEAFDSIVAPTSDPCLQDALELCDASVDVIRWDPIYEGHPMTGPIVTTNSDSARAALERASIEALITTQTAYRVLKRKVDPDVPYSYSVPSSRHASLPEILRLVHELDPETVVLRHSKGRERVSRLVEALQDDYDVRAWVGRRDHHYRRDRVYL